MKTTAANSPEMQVPAASAPKQRRDRSQPEEINDFGRVIQTLLGKRRRADKVSEEELFAGSVFSLVKHEFGTQMARDWKAAFKLALVDKPANEQMPSAERAAKEALDFFVKATIISKDKADSIREVASQICQLDDHRGIWDAYGDTKAVKSFASAQTLMAQRLEEATSGTTPESNKIASKLSYQLESQPVPEVSRRPSRRVKTVG